ncbi:hypothetical protein SCLCIDRAFT_1222264 [Scleroderma citrinum Foug A]|uniref:Uncharacterized protein n=1 Tax=Scleroderma citrinum Foug A TaxID=1036808 RepID=A0A0C2YWQ2_9AGAM|nr:hypothetical protein SCLCIDRAFT_1222264 [Scleroderma citrinum Foug A]
MVHKIKGMKRKVKIRCHWDDCQCTLVRHNFVRHIREAHLDSERRMGRKFEKSRISSHEGTPTPLLTQDGLDALSDMLSTSKRSTS